MHATLKCRNGQTTGLGGTRWGHSHTQAVATRTPPNSCRRACLPRQQLGRRRQQHRGKVVIQPRVRTNHANRQAQLQGRCACVCVGGGTGGVAPPAMTPPCGPPTYPIIGSTHAVAALQLRGAQLQRARQGCQRLRRAARLGVHQPQALQRLRQAAASDVACRYNLFLRTRHARVCLCRATSTPRARTCGNVPGTRALAPTHCPRCVLPQGRRRRGILGASAPACCARCATAPRTCVRARVRICVRVCAGEWHAGRRTRVGARTCSCSSGTPMCASPSSTYSRPAW